jgi:hypothetical protein
VLCSNPVGGFPWFKLNINVNIGSASEPTPKGQDNTANAQTLDFLHSHSQCKGQCLQGKCVLDTSSLGGSPCWELGANLLTCMHPSINKLLQLLVKHC